MIIGGTDIIYPRRLSSDMLGFVLTTIRGYWPDAILWIDGEYTADHKVTIYDAIRDTVGSPSELLIYADQDAWASWDRDGANEENRDKLLHILFGENQTTFVVHAEPGITQTMVKISLIPFLDRYYPPLNRERLSDFIQKSLEEKMKPFIDQEATPALRKQIETVVRDRLNELADQIKTRAPEIEAVMSEPGVVSFRFLGPLDYKMHLALYNAGLVKEPPVEPYIMMTFEIGPEKKNE